MGYPINEKLISHNRSGEKLNPQGFVIHSTATPGATDEREQSYFDSANRSASAHYFADWDSITRCVPENEVAWHSGKTSNHKFLSIEMCEPAGHNEQQFQEVWNRTVWLVANACVRYGWNTKDNVYSHKGISVMWHETTHTDPYEFLQSYGRSWGQLLVAIDTEIANQKKSPPTPPSDTEPYKLYRDGQLVMAFKTQPEAITYGTGNVNNGDCKLAEVKLNGNVIWSYTKPTPQPQINYENEVFRIFADEVKIVSLTGQTKCTEYAKNNLQGKNVKLQCVKDGKEINLGAIPVPQPPTPPVIVEPDKPVVIIEPPVVVNPPVVNPVEPQPTNDQIEQGIGKALIALIKQVLVYLKIIKE